jgi:hypothetical protein
MANAKIQEAVENPIRAEKEKRELGTKATLKKHKGKNLKAMTKAEMDELLIAICQMLGIADEAGVIK